MNPASGSAASPRAEGPRRAVPVLGIVVPCFNEEAVLPETLLRLERLLQASIEAGAVDAESRLWFVDDGSRDATWSLIAAAAQAPKSLTCGIKLTRNCGHQIALLAGLMNARGDALISLDADLQDDLAVIPQMLAAHRAGHEIVYGVRTNRAADSVFKMATAGVYYRVLRALGVEVVLDHADFRLMSRRAVEALRGFPESNVFLRGMIPQLGLPSTTVGYARLERFAGETKYPLRKMLALAWQGVTSFTAAPLRAITSLGMAVSLLSLAMGVWAIGVRLFNPGAVPGWASIVIPLFLISGVQLLSLGVIGEYLSKVFIETKRRPLYFVEHTVLASSGGRAGRTLRRRPRPPR